MGLVADRLSRMLRKLPAVAGATVDGDRVDVEALGTVAGDAAPETLVWETGSITKVFTGILLAHMSITGEVNLDDPIGAHAPDDVAARLPDRRRQPTLADLATHTAGFPQMPRAWVRRIGTDPDPYAAIDEHDVWALLGPDTTRPGRVKPRYSNVGFGLLGILLGRAAGSTYEQLVTERILGPLGMGSSGFSTGPVVPGYRRRKPTPPWTFRSLGAAGGLRSTIADMVSFARSCLHPPDGELGEAIARSRMPVHETRTHATGLGWQIRKLPRSGAVATWHNGGTYGGSSFLAIHTSEPRAVITFGNAGPRLLPPLDGPSWKIFDDLGKQGGPPTT